MVFKWRKWENYVLWSSGQNNFHQFQGWKVETPKVPLLVRTRFYKMQCENIGRFRQMKLIWQWKSLTENQTFYLWPKNFIEWEHVLFVAGILSTDNASLSWPLGETDTTKAAGTSARPGGVTVKEGVLPVGAPPGWIHASLPPSVNLSKLRAGFEPCYGPGSFDLAAQCKFLNFTKGMWLNHCSLKLRPNMTTLDT